jgi:hypothetical protein
LACSKALKAHCTCVHDCTMQQARLVRGSWKCPHCGGVTAVRQVAVAMDQRGRLRWADDRRFCTHGCALSPASANKAPRRSTSGPFVR